MPEPLEQRLASLFKQFDYKWTIVDNKEVPDERMIRTNLDAMKKLLYDEPDGTQMMLGRLIVLKVAPDKFDVFMMIGEDNGL